MVEKKTYTTSPPKSELIAEYIHLWKTMGFDFDGPPSSYMTDEDDHADLTEEILSLKDLVYLINSQKLEIAYELHEALKIVYAKEQRFWIKKFNVREVATNAVKTVEVFEYEGWYCHELIEWRLKDGCHETLPPQHRGLFPRPENAPKTTPPPDIPNPILPRTTFRKYPSWKAFVPFPEDCYEYEDNLVCEDYMLVDPALGPRPRWRRHPADFYEKKACYDEVLEDEDFDLPDE